MLIEISGALASSRQDADTEDLGGSSVRLIINPPVLVLLIAYGV